MNIKEYKEKLFKSDTRKRLIENFLSLSVLQIANYILPLITLPYLVRVLGPEKFGLIAFSQAFIGYFMILTDYGFNLSATRDISINREDREKVSEIFSSVMIIKLALMIISLILMTVILFSFEKFRKDWIIYYLTFGMIVGQVLFPVWFFQGMEKMKYITFLNILAKVIFTVAIFVFVKEASDYLYVPLLNSLGFIIAGILGLWIVFRDFGISFKFASLEELKRQLKEGWYVFISTISINFYKNNAILILGLFTNNKIVGYFIIAKKLVDMLNNIAGVISQTIYPYVSKQINTDYKKTMQFLKKVGLLIAFYTFVFGVILFIFSSTVIYIISGDYFNESILCLKLMAFVPMFIGVNVPAVQILLGKGLDKNFSKVLLIGAILDIILNFLIVPIFSYIGSCISVIVVELFVTIFLYIEILKLKEVKHLEP
jgi:PST family polysaccharide transporter